MSDYRRSVRRLRRKDTLMATLWALVFLCAVLAVSYVGWSLCR